MAPYFNTGKVPLSKGFIRMSASSASTCFTMGLANQSRTAVAECEAREKEREQAQMKGRQNGQRIKQPHGPTVLYDRPW